MSAPVCPVNLRSRGRRHRRLLGVVALGLSLLACGLLVAFGAPRALRLVLFVPLLVGGLGLFQGLAGT